MTGMGTVLMTNPPRSADARKRRTRGGATANPPGLSLAVIGNPGRRSNPQGTTMKKKRSSKRRARRAAVAHARAATKTRTTATRRRVARRRRPAPSASLGAVTVPAAKNPSRKYWRVGKRIPWKNPSSRFWRVATKTPWKNPRRRRRNPPTSAVGGLMADFTGLGSALAAIGKQPMGLAWTAGGAAVTAVGGNLVAAQVARVMPAMGPGLGRMVNAAVFAGVAVGASRLVKDPRTRRQMMAGGLAVAAIELLAPGKTYALAAKVPGLNRLLPAPTVGADPAAMLAARRGLAGYGDDGVAVVEDEPVAVDGIADDGEGDGDPAALPSPEGNHMGELVPTYLNGLGCPLSGRSNELTKLVTP
jgi:hypothetical protein